MRLLPRSPNVVGLGLRKRSTHGVGKRSYSGLTSGMSVLRITDESTVAEIAYVSVKKSWKDVLFYDLSGGAFDASPFTIDLVFRNGGAKRSYGLGVMTASISL